MTGEVIDLKVEPAIVILLNGQVPIVMLLNVVRLPSIYLHLYLYPGLFSALVREATLAMGS